MSVPAASLLTMRKILQVQISLVGQSTTKKRIFYGQADHKGGGGVSPIGPNRKQMWEFWPIFSIEIWFFVTQKWNGKGMNEH